MLNFELYWETFFGRWSRDVWPLIVQILTGLRTQVKTLPAVLLRLYVLPLLVLGLIELIEVVTGVPASSFTRDPVAVAKLPFYVGIASNIGVGMWSATSAVCFLSYALLRDRTDGRKPAMFFLVSGLMTLIFMLDDMALLHEIVVPTLFGLSEKYTFAFYILILSGYLVLFGKTILETDYLLLLVALVFFAGSLIADAFHSREAPFHHMYEDGAKLMGIVAWLGYYGRSAIQAVKGEFPRTESAAVGPTNRPSAAD